MPRYQVFITGVPDRVEIEAPRAPDYTGDDKWVKLGAYTVRHSAIIAFKELDEPTIAFMGVDV